LLDRQDGVAEETSFGNAGQVSPGYSTPWAAPGIPLKAIKWMLQEARAAGHSPRRHAVPAALDGADAAQLLARGATRSTRNA
jgi:hypothetical protein